MAYNHLFLDSDVLLDWLLQREPFSSYTQRMINEAMGRGILISTSVLIIANTHYIIAKHTSAANAKQNVRILIKLINVLPFESDIINLAIDSSFADFEDSIQYNIANRFNCDAIITRNIKDYKRSNLSVLTAEQFLRQL